MRRAALGFRAHSGWAVLVAVAEPSVKGAGPMAPMVIERRRIEIAGAAIAGGTPVAVQPYHLARELDPGQAGEFIERNRGEASRLAEGALRAAIEDLRLKGWAPAGCGILLASGRPLPPLAEILASHSLIHAAEGEMFRNALEAAGESCGLRVIGVKERDLYSRAAVAFGVPAEELRSNIEGLGRTLGSPWRQDEKYAALVGWLALAEVPKAG